MVLVPIILSFLSANSNDFSETLGSQKATKHYQKLWGHRKQHGPWKGHTINHTQHNQTQQSLTSKRRTANLPSSLVRNFNSHVSFLGQAISLYDKHSEYCTRSLLRLYLLFKTLSICISGRDLSLKPVSFERCSNSFAPVSVVRLQRTHTNAVIKRHFMKSTQNSM